MPKQQKRPPGGAAGPRETRVYAPTHRAGNEPPGRRMTVSGEAGRRNDSSKDRERTSQKPVHSQAGQAVPRSAGHPQQAQRSSAEGLRSSAGPAQTRPKTQARPQTPSQSSGTKYAASAERTAKGGPQPKRSDYAQSVNKTRVKHPGAREAQDRLKAQAKAQLRQETNTSQTEPEAVRRQPKVSRTKKAAHGLGNIHRLEPIGHQPAEQDDKTSAKVHKKERKPLDRRKLITVLTVLVAAFGLMLAGYFVFLLDTVTVDGNKTYSSDSIVALSGLKRGEHMLMCNLGKVKSNIESNPYLKVVSIRRELPRTIRISVEERKEIAVIAGQGYDVIIDVEGYVLSIGAGSDLSNLLRVNGMSQIGFHVNQKLGANSDFQTRALLSMIQQLQGYDLLKDTKELDLSNPLNVCLYTRDGITVMIGQPENLAEKLAWMRDALPSLREGGITSGTLDVSAKGGAIFSPALPSATAKPQQTGNTNGEQPSTSQPDEQQPDGEKPEEDTGTRQKTADPAISG